MQHLHVQSTSIRGLRIDLCGSEEQLQVASLEISFSRLDAGHNLGLGRHKQISTNRPSRLKGSDLMSQLSPPPHIDKQYRDSGYAL